MSAIIATRGQIHPELAAARDHDAGQIQCELRALRDHRDVGIVFLRNLPLWVVAVVVTWLTRALVVNLGPFATTAHLHASRCCCRCCLYLRF
jgi:hypothetical protein